MANQTGIDIGVSNPIAFAHMQLRGGWKNTAIVTGVYALAIGAIMIATIRFDPRATTRTLSAWATGLLVLQAVFLTFLSCGTINSAIRVDTTSHMMESHRLMPISPASAVLGYLFGAPFQYVVMAAVTFLLGWFATLGAQLPSMRWLVANAVLGMFALLLWSGVVFFALAVKHGARWYFGFLIGVLCSQALVLFLLPGLTLLASPMMHGTIFEARSSNSELNPRYVMAMAAQLVLIVIFCLAAARRFRRPDRPAVGTLLSLVLLGAWIAISAVGTMHWEEIRPFDGMGEDTTVQFVATMAASTLLALLVTTSANWAEAQWRRHRQLDDPAPRRRPMPAVLAALLAASLILGLTWLPSLSREMPLPEARLRTWLTIALFLMATGYLQQIMYRVRGRSFLITGVFVVLLWVGPFLADTVRYAMAQEQRNPPALTALCAASPLGLMISIWSPEHRHPVNTNPGLILLACLAAAAAFLYYRPLLVKRPAGTPKAP
jgi:hypothetical protein